MKAHKEWENPLKSTGFMVALGRHVWSQYMMWKENYSYFLKVYELY